MKGRARKGGHKIGAATKGGCVHPMLTLGYGFLRDGAVHDEDDANGEVANDVDDTGARKKHGGTTVLFGLEAKFSLGLAMVVPGKANAKKWIARSLANWINYLGESKVILKADNEISIVALLKDVRRARADAGPTMFEHPPEGVNEANSYAEGGVGSMKGLIRTLKHSTEHRLGIELGPAHPLLP